MKTEQVKNAMIQGMKINYEKYGELTPIYFYCKKDDDPCINMIPQGMLNDHTGKLIFMTFMRSICVDKSVECAGIILEAYAKKLAKEDAGLTQLLSDGTLRVAELAEKDDIIVMVFATPENEETISFIVSPKERKVLGDYVDGLPSVGVDNGGVFSQFFSERKRLTDEQ